MTGEDHASLLDAMNRIIEGFSEARDVFEASDDPGYFIGLVDVLGAGHTIRRFRAELEAWGTNRLE